MNSRLSERFFSLNFEGKHEKERRIEQKNGTKSQKD